MTKKRAALSVAASVRPLISVVKTEATARVKIDALLANVGWKPGQITRETALYPEQRTALGRRKPDYVLYEEGIRSPLAVVEAKKEGGDLRGALAQGLDYAKRLGCRAVFASDGNVVITGHLGADSGGPMTMNDTDVSAFLPENHLRHFRMSSVWHRGEGFAASGDLVRLFASARKKLNEDGIAQMEAFHEVAKLIFVKILTELRDSDGEMFRGISVKWDEIANLTGASLMRKYGDVLTTLNEKYGGGFEESKIRSAKVLEALVDVVSKRSFIDTDADVKGEAYEYFLRDHARVKDGLNRHFTPRHIVRAIVNLANPQNGEKIYDPFCGTGGLLIASFWHMLAQLPPIGDKARAGALRNLHRNSFYGGDISDAAHTAKMNMILSGDGHSNINREDSTDDAVRASHRGKYNIVVTNIPFSADKEEEYVRLCLDAVCGRENGRAVIIVPERIVCDPRYSQLRNDILSEWTVERIVSLPRSVFAEYANAKTSILHVSWRGVAGKRQKTIPVFKIIHDGFSGTTRRNPDPAEPNDIRAMFDGGLEPRMMELSEPNFFFSRASAASIRIPKECEQVTVGNVISLVKRPVEIRPGMLCLEPGFDAKEHRIFVKKRKQYSQVAPSGRERLAIRRGDLVIGLMHTQNGLIAFSDLDVELHSTGTHIAFKVDEKKVDRRYLFWTLRGLLMKLEQVDMVGRENYNVPEILTLPFPLPPMAEQQKIGKAMDAAREKIRAAAAALEKSRKDFAAAEDRFLMFDAG